VQPLAYPMPAGKETPQPDHLKPAAGDVCGPRFAGTPDVMILSLTLLMTGPLTPPDPETPPPAPPPPHPNPTEPPPGDPVPQPHPEPDPPAPTI
jgi:hypothetical protein